jgi:hypothetical protein
MDRSDAQHVSIDFWQLPACDRACLTSTGLIDRLALNPAPRWLPMFRYCGGFLRWALPVGINSIATVSIFTSGEGMRDFEIRAEYNCPDLDFIEHGVTLISRTTGPLVDMFSHGSNANSTLRVLEREGRDALIDTPDARFLTIVHWRYKFDGDPLPDGRFLRDIPPDDRFDEYQRAMVPMIAPHLNEYSLVGCWRANTGVDSFTGIGIYASPTEMEVGWQFNRSPGSELRAICRNLECVDRVAGPITDLMLVSAEQPGIGLAKT